MQGQEQSSGSDGCILAELEGPVPAAAASFIWGHPPTLLVVQACLTSDLWQYQDPRCKDMKLFFFFVLVSAVSEY